LRVTQQSNQQIVNDVGLRAKGALTQPTNNQPIFLHGKEKILLSTHQEKLIPLASKIRPHLAWQHSNQSYLFLILIHEKARLV
jgi:hypothetical protein